MSIDMARIRKLHAIQLRAAASNRRHFRDVKHLSFLLSARVKSVGCVSLLSVSRDVTKRTAVWRRGSANRSLKTNRPSNV